jgi:hypothetical protein
VGWFPPEDRRSNDRIATEIRKLTDAVNDLNSSICELTHALKHKAPRVLGVHVREVQGKERTMALLPPIALLNVERVKIATAPLKADGTPDSTVIVSWASSDPAQVGIEPLPEHDGLDAEGNPITIPDTHAAWATTPLDSGAAEITISAAGYETDVLPISYVPGVPRRLNVSVGTPVPD